MKLGPVSGMMLTLLLIGMLTLAFGIQPVKSEPRTWTVDDDGPADFSSIQDAIDAASPGDTIFVKSGGYCEETPSEGIAPIEITKPLTLLGENPVTTSIDEGWILVYAHNVCINGFTIISHPDNTWHGPVTAWEANNGTLSNNILIGTGIYNGPVSDWPSVIIGGSGWIISQNTILERLDVPTEPLCGLWVCGSRNIVVGNTLGNETVPVDGLEVSGSDNIFYHNNFYLHYGYALENNT